jgi:4-amino-4-deoxy-L-arabinose transferase-like glycosyltransferase
VRFSLNFGSIRFWLALCAVVRLSALLAMLLAKDAFLNREPFVLHEGISGKSAEQIGRLQFLQRRTEYQPLTEDEHCYDAMAQNILGGRGFATDFIWVITTPGAPAMYGGCAYPLFVAGIYATFGAGHELPVFLAQIALQTLALWFVFHVAFALGGSLAASIASAFFTFHPVLVWLSLAMLTEALLVPCVAALLWIVVCRVMTMRMAVAVGGLLAMMALTRSTMGALVWVTIAWILWNKRGAVKRAAMIVAVFVLVCAPWTIRNYIQWHRFIPFSTKSGVNAWFFNHPGLKVEFGRRAVEGPQPIDIFDPRIQGLPDEAARDARLMEMFQEFLREHPGKFVGLCWMRFWMALLPARITSTSTTALISAWYAKGTPLALGISAIIGGIFLRQKWRCPRAAMFLVLVAAYWQAIQTLAGPGLRYRLPVEPVWAVLVGIAAAWMADMLRTSRPPAQSTMLPGN